VAQSSDGEVTGKAWGPAAEWLLDGLPALLGADDDDNRLRRASPDRGGEPAPVGRAAAGARPGRVWDVLVGAILEQKVTSIEARRSWRELA